MEHTDMCLNEYVLPLTCLKKLDRHILSGTASISTGEYQTLHGFNIRAAIRAIYTRKNRTRLTKTRLK